MKKEKILSMPPGRELNMQVAKNVMDLVTAKDDFFGYMERRINPDDGSSIWAPVGAYSEDISIAGMVIDRMIEKGYKDAIKWADFGNGQYNEAEAICKAALLAVLEEHSLKETSDKILREALGDDEDENV